MPDDNRPIPELEPDLRDRVAVLRHNVARMRRARLEREAKEARNRRVRAMLAPGQKSALLAPVDRHDIWRFQNAR